MLSGTRNVVDWRYSRFELCKMRIRLRKVDSYYVLTCVKKNNELLMKTRIFIKKPRDISLNLFSRKSD